MVLLLSLGSSAFACGGFFCNAVQPVLQKAERIVFVVDLVAESVETHVQVEYEGPADEFAWIVPVQAQPELFVTSEMLFTTVGQQLQPIFQMNWVEEGECKWDDGQWLGREAELAALDSDGGVPAPPPAPGVTVVDQATVGPYETVTLQANDLDGLMQWLADNNYAIPSTASGAIAPYISNDGYFVALKLVKGNDVGDLSPLGLRYRGDRPAVPIQLTSVAAADDLRLEVTVFGPKRAVPESYLHVVINDAAIDWFNGGANYDDVITKAADEAGGHAFATDYAGPTDVLFADFSLDADLSLLASSSTPSAWIEGLQGQGFRGTPDMLALFERWFPVQQGLDAIDVYNCPSCYTGWYAGSGFDPQAVTDDFDERILEPRNAIDALLRHNPYVTRMTSSLSASEMTIDPVFVLSDTLGDVDLVRSADLVHECNGRKISKSPRRLELPDGRVIRLPPQKRLEDLNTTESEYLAELGQINAAKIERTGVDAPVTVADFSDELAEQVRVFNARGLNNSILPTCGCQSTPTLVPSMFIGLVGLLGLRRRY